MALIREFAARALVLLALVAGAASLGSWWASLLVVKAAGTLNAGLEARVSAEILAQIEHSSPAAANIPNLAGSITQVLHNPAVTQSLAKSVPQGSSVLSDALGRENASLAPLLHPGTLLVNVGQHDLARLASTLRTLARAAAIAAAAGAAIALVLSPLRHLVARHLAEGATVVGGLALAVSWGIPALIGALSHGRAHGAVATVLSAGAPVRSVLLECFVAGLGVFFATHVFELVGGRRVPNSKSMAPLVSGRAV